MTKILKKIYQEFLIFWKIDGEENYLTLGVKISLCLLVIILFWALLAPINSSIIASGEIVLTSNKKILSHLEGGVIDKVIVQEGQFVNEGEDLIVLNTVQVESKIIQISEAINAAEFQKIASKKRINSLQQELRIVNELLKDENTSLTRKIDIEKQLHESQGKLGEIMSNIVSLNNELKANQYILERSVIRAPTSGNVMNLKYQTVGGTITPASEIMFIVPKNDKLIAELKVKPQHIDLLKEGMKAKIQLSAYKTRLMPKLNGVILNVSADSFKNEMTSEIYFKARVEIPETELQKLKEDIKLIPGMPIDGFLITGSRTLFQYLFTPISESAYKAFREE
ncbi:MAG: HlyD family efflux transporter periplasmic adaptor subunit [Alphaproteobacteria bacterium]